MVLDMSQMNKLSKFLLLYVAIILLYACGDPKLIQPEEKLGTNDSDLAIFHKIAEGDRGLALRFPGYIIGIEKSRQEKLNNGTCSFLLYGHDDEVEQLNRDEFLEEIEDKKEANNYYDNIKEILTDCKRMYVSHIIKYDLDKKSMFPYLKEERIFSVYSKKYDLKNTNIFKDGRNKLDNLAERIKEDVKKNAYTHIFFLSMGWNTDQQEAIRNYNSLIGQLRAQGDETFNPLFIGLTWPSEWSWPWALEEIGKPVSYIVKAPDADEVGILWGSYILRKILIPAKKMKKKNIPLILLGHSFGARVITRSVFGYPGQYPEFESPTPEDIDLVLSIQGAYSVNRFVKGAGEEGAPYQSYDQYAKKFVLTWSMSDTANPIAACVTGAKHAGGKPGFKTSLNSPTVFDQFKINVEGDNCNFDMIYTNTSINSDDDVKEEGAKKNPWTSLGEINDKVAMIDASSLVKFSPYNKGGKAHSDIYTPGMAAFIWDVISKTLGDPRPEQKEENCWGLKYSS